MSEHAPNRVPYFWVFAALMVFTFLTVLVAKVDLGPLNDVVAMAIAVTKGVLVIWIFMHVRFGTRLTKLTAVSGFVWLALMILVIMGDYWSRGAIGVAGK
jgi:cytochrome c oxidase subunit IV